MRVFSLKEETPLYHTKAKRAERSPMRLLSLAPSQLSARMRRGPGSPEYSWEEPFFPLLLPPLGSRASYQRMCLAHLVKPFYFRPCGEPGTPRPSFTFQTFISRRSVRLFLTPSSAARFLGFSAMNVPSTFLFSPEPDCGCCFPMPSQGPAASSLGFLGHWARRRPGILLAPVCFQPMPPSSVPMGKPADHHHQTFPFLASSLFLNL